MTKTDGWSLWRRLAAEFVVIVMGVLVALAVDAAREAREERLREAAYLRQLEADLSATASSLADAITIDQSARDAADRAIDALNSSSLPSSDSLVAWTLAATNSSASFYPMMGTITALVGSGEFRLVRDEELRQQLLRYHGGVQSAMRIIDGVQPHTWRTLERFGSMLSWVSLLQATDAQRFPIEWEALAADRSFHSALYDLRLAAHNRLFALLSLRGSLESLLTTLNGATG